MKRRRLSLYRRILMVDESLETWKQLQSAYPQFIVEWLPTLDDCLLKLMESEDGFYSFLCIHESLLVDLSKRRGHTLKLSIPKLCHTFEYGPSEEPKDGIFFPFVPTSKLLESVYSWMTN